MRNQDIGQAFKACGAGAVFLLWTGCVSVERGTETLEDIVVSAIPRAAGVAMDATNRPPAGGYAWDTLARMAAANCSAAKALLLEAHVIKRRSMPVGEIRNCASVTLGEMRTSSLPGAQVCGLIPMR